ncbi:MAG TPA: GNAT family N-acetyltransferase [Alcaligenes sp.]|nr:GNAT family N-acetyltransferase [Alcaligenes sp.]HRL27676.1 GNAT family N-acetyltransferase [Alcaligenes sp.]
MSVHIQLMRPDDLDDVLLAQADVYAADLLEDRSFYQNRLDLAPHSCWVARDALHRLQGYLISYPWAGRLPPALGDALASLPARPDQWFIHDCAVLRRAQGRGVASALLAEGRRYARRQGLRRCSLVSLGPALAYWEKLGYQPVQDVAPDTLARKLAQYGEQASFMDMYVD